MAIKVVKPEQNERDLATKLQESKKGIESIVSGTHFTTFNGENFAGMNSKEIPAFKAAVAKYKGEVVEILNKLNTSTPTTEAFKGKVAEEAAKFLSAIKRLLEKYVDTIDAEALEVEEANKRWLNAAQELATNIQGDTSEIQSNANQVIDLG